MRHYNAYRMALIAACTISFALGAPVQDVTNQEREQALRLLDKTRDGVVEAVKGMSDAQWNFKPGPDRWSAAEVVEHLALIEDLVKGILDKIGQAAPAAPDRDLKKLDAMILTKIEDRSTKAQAPAAATPAARWTPAEALAHFSATRSQISEILRSTTDLRQHVIPHPVFGPLDGYQWILAVAGHSARHTEQILEVKADPHFPAK